MLKKQCKMLYKTVKINGRSKHPALTNSSNGQNMHRNATINDLNFIFELIMDGAKSGYFNREFQDLPAAANGLHLELASILTDKTRANGLTAYGIIYENKGKRAGFVLMSAGEEDKGNELWMASIKPNLRGKGFGKKMIQGVLEQFKGRNLMLFARCAQESKAMFNLLSKNGFKHVATGEEGYRGMMYEL